MEDGRDSTSCLRQMLQLNASVHDIPDEEHSHPISMHIYALIVGNLSSYLVTSIESSWSVSAPYMFSHVVAFLSTLLPTKYCTRLFRFAL
jgi:hypothetical protein